MNNLIANLKLKSISLHVFVIFMAASSLYAQPQYSYNPGSGTSTNTIPFNVAPTASNRRQILYTPADFPGAQPGLITKVYVMATTAATPILQNVTIKMGTTALTSLASGPWITTNMTTVFSATTFSTSALTDNWIEFTLQTPFAYDNISNFIIDFTQGGNTSGFTIVTYNTGVGTRSKIGNAGAASATGVAQLPIFGFTALPTSPCTSPPPVGNVLANLSQVCVNNTVNLSLNAVPAGVGQSYQWQYSTDSTTWVNMLNDTLSVVTATVPSTRWFRCQVTCGANTTASTPKKIDAIGAVLPSGTYTINGNLPTTGTNYNSFADFKQAIVCGGISGPIVVNVISKGSAYNEQVVFGAVGGTSATNTITINGNGQTLSFGGALSQYATLLFNGAKHFKLKNLTVAGTGTSTCFGIQLTGDAQFIEIDSCTVSINATATLSTTAAFVASASLTSATTAGLNARNITIKNSVFEGGYYGFAFMGPTAAPYASNNSIENNTVRNFHYYGMYISNQDNSTIKGNDIHRAQRTGSLTSFYGLFLVGNMTGVAVVANKIHNPGDLNPTANFANYPLYFNGTNASATAPLLIANNAIYELNGTGLTNAIYVLSGTYINFYHNTVNIDNSLATSSTGTHRALHLGATSGVFEIKNNIFHLNHVGSGVKHLIYLSSVLPTFSIDNNQYYISSPSGTNHVGYYNGANFGTFAAWQAANSGAFDANGVYGDALFSLNNYTPQSGFGNNNGANLLSIVPTDLDGVARTTTPDIGAIEYVPLPCLQPSILGGLATSTSIALNWTNVSGADSVRVEYGPSGFSQGTGTFVNLTGTSHNFTGLFSQTCYDFYFTSWCGGIIGSGQALYTHCTECGAKPLPLTENFDGVVASGSTTNPGLPECWKYFKSSTHTGYAYTYTLLLPHSPLNHVRFYNNASLNDTLAIISPALQGLTAGNKRVKFWAKTSSSVYNQRVIVGTVASPSQMNTLAIIDTVIASQNYAEYTVYLDSASGYNGTHQYVVFMQGPYSAVQYLYLDDITFDNIPQCNPPTVINTVSITANSAQISWGTASGTSFKLEYGPTGFVQATGQGTIINPATSPTTLSGLSPNTNYDVYVADNCNPNVWTGPFTFKTNCVAQLNGVYTVGGTPGPTNFATLDSAIYVLKGCGISGPVTFNLQGGSYSLQTTLIESIGGANAINTVTFHGGGPATDTIDFGNNANCFDFSGASYITFQNLTIYGPTASNLIWLHNSAHHLTFNNCHLVASTTTVSALSCVIGASSSITQLSSAGNNADYITVTNCKIVGGYYGITVYGTSTSAYATDFVMNNNLFESQYYYGVRLYYVSNITMDGNTMSNFRNTTAHGFYAIYTSGLQLRRNQIFAPTYAVYLNVFNTGIVPVTNSEISNNFAGANTYGIYLTNYAKVNIWHNSFRGGTVGCYALSTNDNIDIRNNIFVGGTSYAFYNSIHPTSGYTLNNNVYHSANSTQLAYQGAAFATLAAWQTAQTTYNANSLQGNPGYLSTTDFHILGSLPNGVGVNGLSVVDIDGDVRPAPGSTTVDIGADEYTPVQFDVKLVSMIEPTDQGCGDSTMAVKIVFENLGLMPATNVSATVNISGAVTTSITATYTGTLPTFGVDTITVSSFNSAAGGSFTLSAALAMTGDQDSGNDSLTKTVVLKDILQRVPFAALDTVCSGSFDTLFYPSNAAGMTFQWLTLAGDTIGTSDSLLVGPMGANDTTFVLREVSSTASVGPLDNTIGLTANYTTMNHYMLFTVNTPTTIFSVDVFAANIGLVDVIIQDGVTLATLYTHSILAPASGKQTLVINQPLQPGTYRMGGSATNNAGGLQRNSSGAFYPYMATDGSVTITGNTFSVSAYYFFYNWQLGTASCPRPDGLVTIYNQPSTVAGFASTLNPPTATSLDVDFDASASINATSYDWDFGDGTSGSGATVTHTYLANGTYNVTLIVGGLCGADTLTQTVTIAGIGIEESLISQTLNVYPNPSNGKFRVEFSVEGLKNVSLRVSSLLGQEIYSSNPGNVSGSYRADLDLSNQATGVYIIQIITDDSVVSRRITIRK